MNSKKIWSLLLLVAISFSLAHDYTFTVLDDQHHSVQEYLSELTTPDSNTDGFIHNIHSEYHTIDICPIELLSFSYTEKIKSIFQHNEIFLSRNYSNFFKPPIA